MMRVDEYEHEKLMYEIIGNISRTNAPIIFKGALITKLILAENHFDDIARQTVDIDANWIAEPPDMDQLVDIVNRSLAEISADLHAESIRQYGDKKSAGIGIIDNKTAKLIVEMDISINKFQESKIYTYGVLTIKGVIPTEIIADKISVLSGNKIFRRTKDLVDIYALSHCIEIKTNEIYASHKKSGRTLGDFSEFRNRISDLNHAYEKLRGIKNKLDFDNIYQYVLHFIEPFIMGHQIPMIWNPHNSTWTAQEG